MLATNFTHIYSLSIPSRHVDTNSVAKDKLHRILDSHIAASRAQSYNHFYFMVNIV